MAAIAQWSDVYDRYGEPKHRKDGDVLRVNWYDGPVEAEALISKWWARTGFCHVKACCETVVIERYVKSRALAEAMLPQMLVDAFEQAQRLTELERQCSHAVAMSSDTAREDARGLCL